MKLYNAPSLELLSLNSSDIILTSGPLSEDFNNPGDIGDGLGNPNTGDGSIWG